jgi:hypothetical protein
VNFLGRLAREEEPGLGIIGALQRKLDDGLL